ncbi:uncharacterized protein KIAA1958-like [Littorina saxatilis]|uniref:uncharacterized protein KIAA1958-like n=1 Tax=Littorina saxatilis TaxID=31220 RepID=UPI0038B57099
MSKQILSPIKVNDIVKINGGEEGVVKSVSRPLGFAILDVVTPNGTRRKIHRINVQKLASLPSNPDIDHILMPQNVLEELDMDFPETDNSENTKSTPKVKKRFAETEIPDIPTFIAQNTSQNTLKKTAHDVKLLKTFIQEKLPNTELEIHQLTPSSLNEILSKYFIALKKADGTDYEATSMRSFWGSIHRHLKSKSYPHDINRSPSFQQAQQTLNAKLKALKNAGKGNMQYSAEALTDEEINTLYERNQLGQTTAESLLNTMWWNNCIHFGLRAVTDHHQMKWGDVTLGKDSSGKEYLSYNERSTKTRTGEHVTNIRAVRPTVWATPQDPTRCPVATYRLYAEYRPKDYSGEDDPFYIATTTVPNPKPGTTWLKKQRVGVNKLATLMKDMAIKAGLTQNKRITNHSARKTMVQTLVNKQFAPTEIMQLTGHKNVQSINTYSKMSEETHKKMSTALAESQSTPQQSVTSSTHLQSTTADIPTSSMHTYMHQEHTRTATMQNSCSHQPTLPFPFFGGSVSNCTININVNPPQSNSTATVSLSVTDTQSETVKQAAPAKRPRRK